MEKLKQVEAERFLKLELNRNLANSVLLDEPRLRVNIRVASGYLNKLYSAITYYRETVADFITSEEMDGCQLKNSLYQEAKRAVETY